MAIVHYTEASGGLPNSGRLSGTDGDLVGILDVVLVAAGWAISFTSGTDRVYRPASGNRFVLAVRDAAAVSGAANFATVRGAESASAVTTYTDPFQTVAQLSDANSNWIKSSTVNTTARNFDIYASPTWVIMFVNFSSTSNTWDSFFWGDVAPGISGDSYNTINITRINQTISPLGMGSAIMTSGQCSQRFVWTRSYDGATKSVYGAIVTPVGAGIGNMAAFPAAKAGPTSGIERAKIMLADSGNAVTVANSSTKGLPIRGYLPNLWMPLHVGPGTVNSRDTFTDTAYNAASTFKCFVLSGSVWIIMEETDTWAAPGV